MTVCVHSALWLPLCVPPVNSIKPNVSVCALLSLPQYDAFPLTASALRSGLYSIYCHFILSEITISGHLLFKGHSYRIVNKGTSTSHVTSKCRGTFTHQSLCITPILKSVIFTDYNLQLDGCTVTSSTVKNLGVILDSNLSFENHISNVTKTAFFHLRNISKLRNMLSVSDAEKLVHAFMTSRLDYCNALLGGCPASSINKLQIVQNAAARVLTRSRKYDHITPILQSLHWLPIKFRISYKILLLAYKALNDLAPAYLTNLLSRYNPTRSLRSQNSGLLVVPRIAKSTKGGRTFSYLAPKLWNSLPENVRGSDTLSLFKSRLKTHLFSQAFI